MKVESRQGRAGLRLVRQTRSPVSVASPAETGARGVNDTHGHGAWLRILDVSEGADKSFAGDMRHAWQTSAMDPVCVPFAGRAAHAAAPREAKVNVPRGRRRR